jgi:hypothetical protein
MFKLKQVQSWIPEEDEEITTVNMDSDEYIPKASPISSIKEGVFSKFELNKGSSNAFCQ